MMTDFSFNRSTRELLDRLDEENRFSDMHDFLDNLGSIDTLENIPGEIYNSEIANEVHNILQEENQSRDFQDNSSDAVVYSLSLLRR